MYIKTTAIITNSLHLHIKSLPATIFFLLKYHSECPQKYRIAIIKNLIHRAFYISSSKTIFYKELTNIKQTLVNKNFSNKLIDQQNYTFIKFTK